MWDFSVKVVEMWWGREELRASLIYEPIDRHLVSDGDALLLTTEGGHEVEAVVLGEVIPELEGTESLEEFLTSVKFLRIRMEHSVDLDFQKGRLIKVRRREYPK